MGISQPAKVSSSDVHKLCSHLMCWLPDVILVENDIQGAVAMEAQTDSIAEHFLSPTLTPSLPCLGKVTRLQQNY